MSEFTFSKEEAEDYLQKNDLLRYLKKGKSEQMSPNYYDLARLHYLTVTRKSFTILEFGVGYSTIVLADALRLNEEKWNKIKTDENFKVNNPFKIFAVDSSRKWINAVKEMIPKELKKYIEVSYSGVGAGLFNGRGCHFYKSIPNVVPDFIYLDAPDPSTVKGELNGMSWQNPERTVMSGDILIMEPTLLPRTFVIVDGRTNNVRFLKNNLQRNWEIKHYEEDGSTTMELKEDPLGKSNRLKIDYCLGA